MQTADASCMAVFLQGPQVKPARPYLEKTASLVAGRGKTQVHEGLTKPKVDGVVIVLRSSSGIPHRQHLARGCEPSTTSRKQCPNALPIHSEPNAFFWRCSAIKRTCFFAKEMLGLSLFIRSKKLRPADLGQVHLGFKFRPCVQGFVGCQGMDLEIC